jgi:hypothetical protein
VVPAIIKEIKYGELNINIKGMWYLPFSKEFVFFRALGSWCRGLSWIQSLQRLKHWMIIIGMVSKEVPSPEETEALDDHH